MPPLLVSEHIDALRVPSPQRKCFLFYLETSPNINNSDDIFIVGRVVLCFADVTVHALACCDTFTEFL